MEMNITEKVSYIKGLADGLDLDKDSKEGKLFAAIIDVLEDIAAEVTDNTNIIDEIDEDLSYVEDLVYDDDDDYCTGDCDNCDGCDYGEDDEDDYEACFECPCCHEKVLFDESVSDDDSAEIICPACGAKLDRDSLFELDDDDEE